MMTSKPTCLIVASSASAGETQTSRQMNVTTHSLCTITKMPQAFPANIQFTCYLNTCILCRFLVCVIKLF